MHPVCYTQAGMSYIMTTVTVEVYIYTENTAAKVYTS